MRIGYGYAVACTTVRKNCNIMLGGVSTPWLLELASYDGAKTDIVSKAIGESLIGAAGFGDLASCGLEASAELSHYEVLSRAAQLIREEGYAISNIDLQILMQENTIGEHLEAIKKSLATAMCCRAEQINVKSADERWMGITGHGQGITATAVCLLKDLEN